ncbi:MAG TPA: TonB family protein [candidate division Zixibacteria bacterium]|nr:energy transducer TonB [candidate division Zixibacteria bacterium]MDD4918029.1 TonB family protein [candidate division Zixibacteria bacterium]MDM7974104.1 TonB family protein [candidate division Zixibacteria bacterium]HOD66867.1 TonB family protein [candidate division Zixibacteria bacterium]HOZ08806.1 TonB family protein [candidate division Zixibacteria bacterium]
MATRDIIFSAALHTVVIVVTLVSIPLAQKRELPFADIIRVQLTAPAQLPGRQPAAIPAPPVPQPEVDANPDLPVEPPKPVEKEAVIDKKPEKKPEKKPQPKPQPQPEESAPAASSAAGESPSGAAGSGPQTNAPVGEGSPFGGATIDNPSFTYPWWFTQAFNKIASGFHVRQAFPPDVTCVIYFEVIRSGRVIELRVDQSSGYPDFDDACMTAVSRATPFPPLPREFTDEVLGITVPFKPSQR